MKMIKIVGLLFVVFCMGAIQAMEPEQDEYAVDRQFLEGKISANDYLSYIASVSGDYAYKIRAIRNMTGLSYNDFLARLSMLPQMAQRVFNVGNMDAYEKMVKSVRSHQVLRAIDALYADIERGRGVRHGRES